MVFQILFHLTLDFIQQPIIEVKSQPTDLYSISQYSIYGIRIYVLSLLEFDSNLGV